MKALSAVDGRRSILEVVERCRLSAFDVCHELCALLDAGLIRPAGIRVGVDEDSVSLEAGCV